MAKGSSKNSVSVWFWMLALLVMAIPCIGLIMTFVWAFVGENESRKNYFKALLIWYLILVIAGLALFAWGFWPVILENIQYWLSELSKRFVTEK